MSIKEILLPFDVELLLIKKVQAGDLTCLYEAGNLRTIKFGDTEILRMVYGAVRNENWETIAVEISDESMEENENGFIINYAATYLSGDINYRADFIIEGKANNSISFSMKGEALSSFKKNRIGLCILHPIKECAGKNVQITKPAGTDYQSVFPVNISPHQPFLNIQQMDWQTDDGLQATLALKGDVFETEDQRNWTDSSYKTYCTPLQIPFPVIVKAGDKIEHQITLAVKQDESYQFNKTINTTREEKIVFPKIGYCRSNNQEALTEELVAIFKQIPFDHYRVELNINESSYQQQLMDAAKEAILLNTQLELVVFLEDDHEKLLLGFINHLELVKNHVASILVLHKNYKTTAHKLIDDVYPIFKKAFPLIQIGYGTNAYFTELNRIPPEQSPCDFVSFSINPQVHASDTRTLLENLEHQPDLITTARLFFFDKSIHVSPVTLKKRSNPDATADAGNIQVADARQHTYFNAFWTLLCVQNFSEAGFITFYELLGEAGIYRINQPSPVYEVLKALKQFNPQYVIKRYCNADLVMDGLMVENEKGERLVFKFV